MKSRLAPFALFLLLLCPPARGDDELQKSLERIEALLNEWRFGEAEKEAQILRQRWPEHPAALLQAAWVEHHFSRHRSAQQLAGQVQAELPGWSKRLELIKRAADISRGWQQRQSPSGQVVVFFSSGPEEILVEPLFDTLERTLRMVGEVLDHRAETPVRVELLSGEEALSALTGLEVQSIRTSRTIAVCKFGRLLVTSPAATLTGYGWADTVSHELVHLIISQKTRNRTPIWLHEALARYLDTLWRSDEPLYTGGLEPLAASRLARALRENRLITFEQMHPSMALLPSAEAAELAFAEVYTVADFLRQRWGWAGIRGILEKLAGGKNDLEALAEETGMEKKQFERAWLSCLKGQKLRELSGGELLERLAQGFAAEQDNVRPLEPRQPGLGDHFHLGELLRARGRVLASLVEYRRAVELAGPHHAVGWLLEEKLGIALSEAGKNEQARQAFENSLRQNPSSLESHLRLGLLLVESEPRLAWLHAREAERINPLDPRVQRLALQASEKLAVQDAAYAKQASRHKRAIELLSNTHQLP